MSRSFETNKNLIIISFILNWIFAIPNVFLRGNTVWPYISYTLSGISLLLFFIGMKGLAEHYKDKTIYQNTRKIIIYGIVAIISLNVTPIIGNFISRSNELSGGTSSTSSPFIITIITLIVAIILVALIAICYREILRALANHTSKQEFRTASDLMYYGILLAIVFVGLFLIFAAIILMIIALYSLKETDTKTKYCTQCGTQNAPENTFCPNCGKQT